MDKDDVKFLSMLLLFIFLVVFAISLFSNYFGEYQCNNYQDITGRESEWVFMDACYVKDDKDKWIRYDSSYKE